MKTMISKCVLLLAVACIALSFEGCKKKEPAPVTESPATTATDNTATATPEPVTIAPDDALTNNVQDAVKDFPGVNASVSDGEITLTGDITRDRLTALMQSLHALNPKKINNKLTIKK